MHCFTVRFIPLGYQFHTFIFCLCSKISSWIPSVYKLDTTLTCFRLSNLVEIPVTFYFFHFQVGYLLDIKWIPIEYNINLFRLSNLVEISTTC